MASAVLRIFVGYVLLESVAVAALIWALGFGWTVLVLLGAFAVGLAVSAGQVRRQVGRLRSQTGRQALADSSLVAAGTALVVVPGPVTTLIGLLLLAPPTRSVARLLLGSLATVGLGRRYAPLFTAAAVGRRWYGTRRAPGDGVDYIDAEFTDVTDARPRALPVG